MLIIVLRQFFFVTKRSNALLVVHAQQFLLNIAVNLLFIRLFGLKGIVLSTLVTSWFLAGALFVLFRRSREL